MISKIIQLLQTHEWQNVGTHVEIAKGKNKYIRTWKEVRKLSNRLWQKK